MRSRILFLVLAICLISQSAFSTIIINETLGVGDVLDIPFTTPSGGITDFNNSVLALEVIFIPTVNSTDYLSANLFVGNSLLGSNSGSVFSNPPPYGELFGWINKNSSQLGHFATPINFSPLLNGTNQGLIQVSLVSTSNPVTINTVDLFYGSSTDGGFTITAPNPEGFTYSASVAPVPLPSAALLLGSSLLGLAGWRRFRKP
jgi:hypothetical protein